MAVSEAIKQIKDSGGTPFNAAFQDKDGTGASLAPKMALRSSAGADIDPATDESVQAITTKLNAGVPVTNFPATQPVSAASLPLPAGAATSALQTTGNTALGTPADAAYADATGAAAGSMVALLKGAYLQLGNKTNPGVHPVATPTATALNYTAGQCIGAPLPLANFVRQAGLSSLIQSAVMRAVQEVLTGEIDIVLFRGQPTVTTGLADGVAFSVAAADTLLVSKVLRFASWDNLGVGSIAEIDSIGKYLSLASGTTAYVQFVARGTIALTAATDLSVSLALIQD